MFLCVYFHTLKLAIWGFCFCFFGGAKENSFISVEKPHNERNIKRDRKMRTNISIFMRTKINSQLEKSRFNIIFFLLLKKEGMRHDRDF